MENKASDIIQIETSPRTITYSTNIPVRFLKDQKFSVKKWAAWNNWLVGISWNKEQKTLTLSLFPLVLRFFFTGKVPK